MSAGGLFSLIEPYARELGAAAILLSLLVFYLINRGELSHIPINSLHRS